MNACRINYPRESTQLYINNGGINTRVLQPDYTFVSVKNTFIDNKTIKVLQQ